MFFNWRNNLTEKILRQINCYNISDLINETENLKDCTFVGNRYENKDGLYFHLVSLVNLQIR